MNKISEIELYSCNRIKPFITFVYVAYRQEKKIETNLKELEPFAGSYKWNLETSMWRLKTQAAITTLQTQWKRLEVVKIGTCRRPLTGSPTSLLQTAKLRQQIKFFFPVLCIYNQKSRTSSASSSESDLNCQLAHDTFTWFLPRTMVRTNHMSCLVQWRDAAQVISRAFAFLTLDSLLLCICDEKLLLNYKKNKVLP